MKKTWTGVVIATALAGLLLSACSTDSTGTTTITSTTTTTDTTAYHLHVASEYETTLSGFTIGSGGALTAFSPSTYTTVGDYPWGIAISPTKK